MIAPNLGIAEPDTESLARRHNLAVIEPELERSTRHQILGIVEPDTESSARRQNLAVVEPELERSGKPVRRTNPRPDLILQEGNH